MIVELIVVGLAVIGSYSAYVCIHHKLACWLKPNRSNEAERPTAHADPTPSFTVELVRTVLEHQARREDQSRREIAYLMSRLTSEVPQSERTSLPCVELAKMAPHDRNGVHELNTSCGLVGRTFRKLFRGCIR